MPYISGIKLLGKDRMTSSVIGVALLFTALPASGFGQASAPNHSEVKQLAYEGLSMVASIPPHGESGLPLARLDGWPEYQRYVFVRTGAQLKSKQIRDGANLPKWSPDGRKLAILGSCEAASRCVDMVNASGHRVHLTRHPTKIPGESMSALNLAWAPSGDEIAYVEEGRKAWTIISIVKSDGSARREIQRLPCLAFEAGLDWSPDGKKLAFTGCSGASGQIAVGRPAISVVDLVRGSTNVVAEGSDPLWSPDGKMLLFIKAGLNTVNADGTGERKILDGEVPFGLTWLQSGRGIVFGSTRDTGGVLEEISRTNSAPDSISEIFRINVDGTGLQKLASGAGRGLSFTSPIVSPDERQMIVSADSCSSCALLRAMWFPPWMNFTDDLLLKESTPSVLLIDLATGHERQLADGTHPSVVWRHK